MFNHTVYTHTHTIGYDLKMTYFIIIIEQDRGLEAISAALRRQQKVGLAIQDEVSEHNGKNLKKPKYKVTRNYKLIVLCKYLQ